ncbi:hypothetical protein [Flavobacterium sp.]
MEVVMSSVFIRISPNGEMTIKSRMMVNWSKAKMAMMNFWYGVKAMLSVD